eukprot:TRINITY_DN67_c0_g1_i1.p1 TRINITY_DN67_c0_g1~~TRINITY_DN67_c0_g1_i1.p1  ORF type:complete len:188 (-),score=53.36 TRINITY_DN67_c0_g1_i1:26-589(-)
MSYRSQWFNVKKKIQRTNLEPEKRIKTWKIVSGDTVEITKGKDKGKRGKVVKVLRKKNKIVVEGINLRKRHPRFGMDYEGFWFKEGAVSYSLVSLIDPVHDKACKVGIKYNTETGEKLRVSRLKLEDGTVSNAVIPKPLHHQRGSDWYAKVGPKDTSSVVVLKKTFDSDTLNPLKAPFYNHTEQHLD